MALYRKKPVEVDAIQWTGDNRNEMWAFARDKFDVTHPDDRQYSDDPNATAAVMDDLHSTWVLVYDGDYIIRGIKGEFYPCRPDVFAQTYEAI